MAPDYADGDRGHGFAHEVLFDHAVGFHPLEGLIGGDIGGGDRGGSGAAIGHEGITVNCDGPFAHAFQIDHAAEGAPDEALNFHGATIGATAHGIALVALLAGSGEHGVFGGDPSGAFAFEPAGDVVFDGCRYVHVGIAHLDEARAFGMF